MPLKMLTTTVYCQCEFDFRKVDSVNDFVLQFSINPLLRILLLVVEK